MRFDVKGTLKKPNLRGCECGFFHTDPHVRYDWMSRVRIPSLPHQDLTVQVPVPKMKVLNLERLFFGGWGFQLLHKPTASTGEYPYIPCFFLEFNKSKVCIQNPLGFRNSLDLLVPCTTSFQTANTFASFCLKEKVAQGELAPVSKYTSIGHFATIHFRYLKPR